jgi:ABC-type sugar transport system permease subunit
MIYKKKSPLLIFLITAFAFLIVFLYYPFFQNIINTVLKIGGLGRAPEGLNTPWYENYQRLLEDPYMRVALKNTLVLILCTIVFQVGIALILALLVDTIRVGAQFFRTVYFFPIVISATALGLMFNLIFLYKGGMVNQHAAASEESATFHKESTGICRNQFFFFVPDGPFVMRFLVIVDLYLSFEISRNRFSFSFDRICPRTLSLKMFAKSSIVQPT